MVNKYMSYTASEGGYTFIVQEEDGALLFHLKDDADNVVGGDSSSSGIFLEPKVAAHCSYDGTTARLYVNAVLVSSQPLPVAITTNSQTLLIGATMNRFSSVYRFFDGRIDEVCIYDRALTDKEIQTRYDQTNHYVVFRVERVTGKGMSLSQGSWQAKALTSITTLGGKAARSPAPWTILESVQALFKEPFTPLADDFSGQIESFANLFVFEAIGSK